MTITYLKQKLFQDEINIPKLNQKVLTKENIGTDYSYKHEVVWINAIGFLILHLISLYGVIYLFIGEYKFVTFVWGKYKNKHGFELIITYRYGQERTNVAQVVINIKNDDCDAYICLDALVYFDKIAVSLKDNMTRC